MNCEICEAARCEADNFCWNCGAALDEASERGSDDEFIGSSETECVDAEFDEESLLKYYFYRGFDYKEILLFLSKYHNYTISYSTLLRRLKQFRLCRRERSTDANIQLVRQRIQEILNGPGSIGGYRTVWHTLELEGMGVPRIVVQDILKELDPEGCELRKAHRLKRREYNNPGPNFAWHMDGYDKMKPWGFPVHGCIDGYSRRIMWLNVTRSNNLPENTASFSLKTVREHGGCPVELVTDLGTENGLVAAIQSFFRDSSDAHRYVSSPRNQRIEAWWSFYCRVRSSWWRNFFGDLEAQGVIDSTSELRTECLWYCFSGVLQTDCDNVREHWNTHFIRKSRHNTKKGRPDSMFFLPEVHGAANDLLKKLPDREINHVSQHIIQQSETSDYQEYFDYVRESLDIDLPDSWQTALDLYNRLVLIVENGFN